MAEQREVAVKVTVDANQAEKEVKGLNDQLKGTGQAAQKAGDTAKKSTGFFKGLGGVLKTLGIVTIIAEGFNFLREALNKNQRVADTLAAVFGTIASVINQLINIIIDVTAQVSASTNGFDALGKVMGGILRLVINPFKVAFFNIKLAIEAAQLAWEKSPLGKGDPGRIKELTASIEETAKNIKETVKDQIAAGKQVVLNFADAASSVFKVVEGTIEGAKKIDIAATFEQQKSIVRLKNNAELAAAELAGLVEKYDRLAEDQRQIRDDELRGIDERIAANERLGEILQEQRKAQLAQANAVLSAAQAEASQDASNIQLQKAVIEARNNVAAVEAQINSLQSEQKTNAVALAKIKIELGKQEAAATNARLLNEQKAQAELIKDELLKLETKKKIFAEEEQIEIARLKSIVDNTVAGTEARVAAEIELANKRSELAIQAKQLDQQILETSTNRQLELINRQKDFYQQDFQMRAQLLEQQSALLDKQFKDNLITEQQYFDGKRQIAMSEMQIEQDKLNQKKAITDQIIGLFGAESKAGRAALVVKQVLLAKEMIMEIKRTISFAKGSLGRAKIATAEGSAQTAKIGFPQNIPMLIGYAVQAAGIIGAITKAVRGVQGAAGAVGGVSVPTSAAIPTAAPIQPSVSPQAQLQIQNRNAINNLSNQGMRAYVLNSDLQNNEQINAYLSRNASIG